MRPAKIGIRNFAKKTLAIKIDKRSEQSQKFEDEKLRQNAESKLSSNGKATCSDQIERRIRAKFIFYLLLFIFKNRLKKNLKLSEGSKELICILNINLIVRMRTLENL